MILYSLLVAILLKGQLLTLYYQTFVESQLLRQRDTASPFLGVDEAAQSTGPMSADLNLIQLKEFESARNLVSRLLMAGWPSKESTPTSLEFTHA